MSQQEALVAEKEISSGDAPFDLRPGQSRLCTDISPEAFKHDVRRRLLPHLLIVVLRSLIIFHADKFLFLVRHRTGLLPMVRVR